MSLNVKVWQNIDGTEGADFLYLRCRREIWLQYIWEMWIPLEPGVVVSGEAMIIGAQWQEISSCKERKGYVHYAGTAVEEGEITLCVKKTADTRFERIVNMMRIQKAEIICRGEGSYFGGRPGALEPGRELLLPGCLQKCDKKALSILMVDFSCALKPSSCTSFRTSAMREASSHIHHHYKRRKGLWTAARQIPFVFDKTGTLTEAKPVVGDDNCRLTIWANELLRIAACLEEAFPSLNG